MKTADIEAVVAAAVSYFLEHGVDATAGEIAEIAGMSVSKVRRALTSAPGMGCPDGLRATTEARESFSRDFPGMSAGAHRVTVYGPTRDKLREMVLAARVPAPPT